jgi:hypothetical protein
MKMPFLPWIEQVRGSAMRPGEQVREGGLRAVAAELRIYPPLTDAVDLPPGTPLAALLDLGTLLKKVAPRSQCSLATLVSNDEVPDNGWESMRTLGGYFPVTVILLQYLTKSHPAVGLGPMKEKIMHVIQ